MQRIERYGVIALVFLLVTIVAVSLWGEQRKAGGLFKFLQRDSKGAQVGRLVAEAPAHEVPNTWQAPGTRTLDERGLPLARETDGLPIPRAELPPVSNPPAGAPESQPSEHDSPFAPEPVPQAFPVQTDPPIAAPPPSDPVARAPKPSTYTIRKDDTLSQIAQRELGSVKRLPELLEVNPKLDPRKLLPGQVIQLPVAGGGEPGPNVVQNDSRSAVPTPERKLEQPVQGPVQPPVASPSVVSGRRYTVRSGDTLGQVAQRELGSTKRMNEILALNKGLDADRLLAGTTILLPAGSPPARSTEIAKADIKAEAKPQPESAPATPVRSKVR
jgi:nucleoid-associated protein YgaU